MRLMTLLDYFADAFKPLSQSVLAELISTIPAFNFDEVEGDITGDLKGTVGVGDHVPTELFLKTFVENNMNNVVQRSNDDLPYELFIASIIAKKPRLFINNPFTILNSQDSNETAMRVWQENFNSSADKERILKSLQNFIGNHKAMNRLGDNIQIIIDELFSNALFNAPVDENGYRIFKHLDRNAQVEYPGSKSAKIFAVHTAQNLFIGAADPWGSIDRNNICEAFYRAYKENSVSQDLKGAGLGLRMMLDRSRSVYILSEKAVRTLVCCHMRLNISLKKIENVPKQLHINCF